MGLFSISCHLSFCTVHTTNLTQKEIEPFFALEKIWQKFGTTKQLDLEWSYWWHNFRHNTSFSIGNNRPRPGDIMISFLPLAHMLERCCENGIFYSGAAVGFGSGNIRNLKSDLKSLKPTIMPAVPRLLNRVYDRLQDEIATSSWKRILFRMALKYKMAEMNHKIIRKNSIWDKLVFRRIQNCKIYF